MCLALGLPSHRDFSVHPMHFNQDYNNIYIFLKEVAQYVRYIHVVGVVGRRFYKQFVKTLCTRFYEKKIK